MEAKYYSQLALVHYTFVFISDKGYNAGPKDNVEITNQLQLSKESTYGSRVNVGMRWS